MRAGPAHRRTAARPRNYGLTFAPVDSRRLRRVRRRIDWARAPSRAPRAQVLIQISRPVRLTLSESELKSFQAGEIYEVPPAIGGVFIGDGWAFEVVSERRGIWNDAEMADDRPGEHHAGS